MSSVINALIFSLFLGIGGFVAAEPSKLSTGGIRVDPAPTPRSQPVSSSVPVEKPAPDADASPKERAQIAESDRAVRAHKWRRLDAFSGR